LLPKSRRFVGSSVRRFVGSSVCRYTRQGGERVETTPASADLVQARFGSVIHLGGLRFTIIGPVLVVVAIGVGLVAPPGSQARLTVPSRWLPDRSLGRAAGSAPSVIHCSHGRPVTPPVLTFVAIVALERSPRKFR
jgi:hypothetical protein